MSELRKQLQAAKATYRSMKYPGNLAAQVLLPAAVNHSWRWKLMTGALAAAAALAVIMWPRHTATDTTPTIAGNTAPTQTIELLPELSPSQLVPGAPDIDGTEVSSADDETLSTVIDEIPSMPQIGPLWAANDFPSGEYEPLVPSFPSFTELTSIETMDELTDEPTDEPAKESNQ